MIFTKLLLITLALCCLATVFAGKLPKTKRNSNSTEVAPTKTEVSTTIVKTEDKSSSEEEEADSEDDEDDDVDEDDAAEKNALKPADKTSLSVWGAVRGVWNWIKDDLSESLFGAGDDSTTSAVGEGRTFGKIRRLQMALIPIIFKFGILTAMVAFLVILGLKTLFLVKMLFLMNALAILAKFFTLKTNFGHVEHVVAPQPQSWSWNPHASSGWQSAPVEHADVHPSKEIHLHIHGAQGLPQVAAYSSYNNGQSGHTNGWESRNDPYGAYETLPLQSQQNDVQNELTNDGSVKQVNANYPSNHRMF